MYYELSGSTPSKQRAFIKKPIFNFQNNALHYLDALTYVSIKSFNNVQERCFPSHLTICAKSSLSKTFIIESTKRLVMAGYLDVERRPGFQAPNKSYSNYYYFTEFEDFNPIPKELLSVDLTPYEKAMLLVLRQNSHSSNQVYGSIQNIADANGLTHSVINKQYKSLVRKGYLDDSKIKNKITEMLNIDWSFPEHLKTKPIIAVASEPMNFILR